MSLSSRLSSAKNVVAVLKRLPDDTNRIYPSFRAAQLALYESNDPSVLPTNEVLALRSRALESLAANSECSRFPVSARLLAPSGKPDYYDMVTREAKGQNKRANPLRIIMDTAYGWWK